MIKRHRNLAIVSGVLLLFAALTGPPATASCAPNFVLVMCDDLAGAKPEVVERMKSTLEAWIESCKTSDEGGDY